MNFQKMLNFIEEKGNRLPSPTMMFVGLCAGVLGLSLVASLFDVSAVHPITGQQIFAVNLLSKEGLHRILTQTVTNFIQFAPVGSVLIAIMGIGVAEHSGLINAVLRATLLKAPQKWLSFFVVMCGALSSLAADSGYVILIPLVALIYQTLGRHPIVGIAAAFAGVSGGFSANLIIGPFDTALAGISQEAAQLVSPQAQVSEAGNYYFLIVSTFFIAAIGAFVTEKIIAPRFEKEKFINNTHTPEKISRINPAEKRALKATLLFSLVFFGIIAVGLIPTEGFLKSAQSGDALKSPFMKGIVTVIAFYSALAGIIYGRVSGNYKRAGEFVAGMEQHMATMASYLVLMFFAAQFVSYFLWSNLGSILAISGATFLGSLDLPMAVILFLFILLVAVLNLFIGTGSGKWALIAPIFVPMLLLLGINPEATQMAYRIGDSTTNIITPLMPYFGVVVAFAQKYDAKAGVGTIISMMLPYSIIFLFAWVALFLIWISLGIPLGVIL